jgi:uncharacterized protein YbjT (DUF2867 family)
MRIAVAGGTGVVGKYVVAAVKDEGHEPVVLSRSRGVDLTTGNGLERALDGVGAIIDVTNSGTGNRRRATSFFTEAVGNLHEFGSRRRVEHLVVLSIVGVDRIVGNGCYRAKLAQENAAGGGPLPTTVVRATQFHEFGAQIAARTRIGPIAFVPVMEAQPVAARSVGALLVDLACLPPSEALVEVAGPSRESLVLMARATAARRRRRLWCIPLPLPGAGGRAMRDGSQCPVGAARIVGPDFHTWLSSDDALLPAF